MLGLIGYMVFFHPEMSLENQCQLFYSYAVQGIINGAFVHVKIVFFTITILNKSELAIIYCKEFLTYPKVYLAIPLREKKKKDLKLRLL